MEDRMFHTNSALALTAAVVLLFTISSAFADDMSDMADWCATKATAPSSVVICSDLELRRMAVVRNKIFADARANLSPDEMKELETDQNQWIHEYTASCGASVNGPPAAIPISLEIIDCFRRAGRERIAELVRQLRDVIPDYQVPAISSLAPANSQIPSPMAPNGKATFKVIDIPTNDVLNIREQPTSQSRIIGVMPPNAAEIVYEGRRSDDGRWLLIRYGDTIGWAASRYLQESSVPAPAAPVSPPSAPPLAFSEPLPAPSDAREREKAAEAERAAEAKRAAEAQQAADAKRAAEAQRAAEETRRQLQKKAAEDQLRAKLKELGFQLLEPADLDLDWKTFMANNAKIAVRGTYVEVNDVEVLSTPDNKDLPRVQLFTSDASRAARKVMLECRNSDFTFSSCQMVVGATIQRCIRNKGELNEREVPCLKVQEAYLVP
jgi:uncharacterized protein YraI